MRKLLGLIGAFTLTASATNPMMACSSPVTYNTVAAAIEALNLTSYAQKGTKNILANALYIRNDAINVLNTNNYVAGVKFEVNKLVLFPAKIINTKTQLALTQEDLKDDAILSLELTFTYDNKEVKAASSELNVTTKTDQAIVDYINGYNYSKLTSKMFIGVGITVADFKDYIGSIQVGSVLFNSNLGSFATFVTLPFFKDCNIAKKDGSEITQTELDKVDTIALTSNYKYGKVDKQQSVNFSVNISKFDLLDAKVTYATDLPITLPDTSKNSLTEAAVTTIKTEIKKEIQTTLVTAAVLSTIAITDYKVTGIEDIVKTGANFTNQTEVTFNIIAKNDSPKFTGKLESQKIKVTVTDKT